MSLAGSVQSAAWHVLLKGSCMTVAVQRSLLDNEELEFQPSPFFSEQLTAFELWLEHGSSDKKPPEQLPIVLQVCSDGIAHCTSSSSSCTLTDRIT